MEKKDFIDLLKKHDWYYQYSDDSRVYNKGKKERDYIERIVQIHPEFVELYHLYGKTLSH